MSSAESESDSTPPSHAEKNSHVRVRVGGNNFEATARLLDPKRDATAWQMAQQLEREKYGWGDGYPVEITPAS